MSSSAIEPTAPVEQELHLPPMDGDDAIDDTTQDELLEDDEPWSDDDGIDDAPTTTDEIEDSSDESFLDAGDENDELDVGDPSGEIDEDNDRWIDSGTQSDPDNDGLEEGLPTDGTTDRGEEGPIGESQDLVDDVQTPLDGDDDDSDVDDAT